MIRVLADSECFLSYFLNQSHSIDGIERLFEILIESGEIEIYFVTKCLHDIKYYLGIEDEFWAQETVEKLEKNFAHRIIPINKQIKDEARKLRLNDYDSALELACAKHNNLGAIVTPNPGNFGKANLSILSIQDLFDRYDLEKRSNKNSLPFLLSGELLDIQTLGTSININREIQLKEENKICDSKLKLIKGILTQRLVHKNLKYVDLSNVDLENSILKNFDLRYADLRNTNLQGADLRGANLCSVNFQNVIVDQNTKLDDKWYLVIRIANRKTINQDLRNINLSHAVVKKANLRYVDLSHADLRYVDLRYADLWGANLSNSDLSNADLRHANLWNANLSNANISNANLNNASLRYADLTNSNLKYADLRYVDLTNSNLQYSNLENADLSYSELKNANLDNTNLSYANLESSILTNANIRNAKLIRSKLHNAGFYKAKLSHTSCTEADFRNAYLVEVDLTDTKLERVEFMDSRLGFNLGLSEIQKSYLITKGAKFEDVPSSKRTILISN